MTLMIDLDPELESRLRGEAAKHGLDAGEFARQLIEQHLPAPIQRKSLWETLSPEEWARAFDEYLARHDPTKPPLPPEAFERASSYGGRH